MTGEGFLYIRDICERGKPGDSQSVLRNVGTGGRMRCFYCPRIKWRYHHASCAYFTWWAGARAYTAIVTTLRGALQNLEPPQTYTRESACKILLRSPLSDVFECNFYSCSFITCSTPFLFSHISTRVCTGRPLIY